jgi:cob(I)alamin adenosyltransferase
MSEAERDAYHAEKMRKKKEARNKILATKTRSAACSSSIPARARANRRRPSAWCSALSATASRSAWCSSSKASGTGERDVLDKFPELVTINAMGEGFTWDVADRQRDLAAARAAWEQAKALIADESYKLVLLDELNIVLRYDYLPARRSGRVSEATSHATPMSSSPAATPRTN